MLINLKQIPHSSGVYYFISNNEIIYIGSSKNLYQRMTVHNTAIKQGSNHGYKQDLYQFLQNNPFTVEIQLAGNYKQLEQELLEKHQPVYNSNRALTGIGLNGNEAEYKKEWYEKYKEEILEQQKQYYQLCKEKKQKRDKQLCSYNNETLTLCALSTRLKRRGIEHPVLEAKKFLINKDNI